MPVLVEPNWMWTEAFHVRLPCEHVDWVEEERPRRVFGKDRVGFGVEREARFAIGFGPCAIEDVVEDGVPVERTVLGVLRVDRAAVKEDIHEVRGVGEVLVPAGERGLSHARPSGLTEISRKCHLLQLDLDADGFQLLLEELCEPHIAFAAHPDGNRLVDAVRVSPEATPALPQ